MKRLISLLIVIAAFCGMAFSQSRNNGQITTKTITGIVTDKAGTPLEGATVSATAGAETVETDANGAYSIEVPVWLKRLSASYPGMGEKEQKIKDKTVIDFKMGKKLKKK